MLVLDPTEDQEAYPSQLSERTFMKQAQKEGASFDADSL
jgi:hypothetical protein